MFPNTLSLFVILVYLSLRELGCNWDESSVPFSCPPPPPRNLSQFGLFAICYVFNFCQVSLIVIVVANAFNSTKKTMERNPGVMRNEES